MTKTPPKSSDVRQWARSKGIEVGERGRLSPDVLAAYAAAHGGPAVTAPAKKSAAKKTAAKKTAKKTAAKRAPAKKAAAKPTEAVRPSFVRPPVQEAERPVLRQAEQVTRPAVTVDSARVVALEEQIAKLSARLERLEAAKAASPKRGLFSRN